MFLRSEYLLSSNMRALLKALLLRHTVCTLSNSCIFTDLQEYLLTSIRNMYLLGLCGLTQLSSVCYEISGYYQRHGGIRQLYLRSTLLAISRYILKPTINEQRVSNPLRTTKANMKRSHRWQSTTAIIVYKDCTKINMT